MRPIKFRAWDKKFELWLGVANEMCSWEIGATSGKVASVPIGWNGSEDDADFEIMQFTGLTDKNGKEIYEGDILGGDSISGGYRVFWNDAKAAWDVQGGSGYLTGWITTWNLGIEVIGNIYENPELLK